MLRISYETDGFPPGTVSNGVAELTVTWDDILWSAVTVGRPNRHYVFRHGDASLYEALFRWSMVRMALEQSGRGGYRLRRTRAAKTLDPTEKGAVSYFLGMTFCKLFAAKLLNTPWLLHLDVFRPSLDPFLRGRSRPDLVGKEHRTTRWHAFECKGRSSPPDLTAKTKAKEQAQRLVTVKGSACVLHVGAITHFSGDVLQFYWRDPVPEGNRAEDVPFSPHAWQYYYAPIIGALRHADRSMLQTKIGATLELGGVDVGVGVHPAVADLLFDEQWESAQKAATEASSEIERDGYQPDGLLVRAGESWYRRFTEDHAFEE